MTDFSSGDDLAVHADVLDEVMGELPGAGEEDVTSDEVNLVANHSPHSEGHVTVLMVKWEPEELIAADEVDVIDSADRDGVLRAFEDEGVSTGFPGPGEVSSSLDHNKGFLIIMGRI